MAALRHPTHARLHAQGGLLAAEAPRGQDSLAGVPRARRRHRDRHVLHGVRHAGGVLPESCGDPREGRAGRTGMPRFPTVALEAPAHQQCPGAHQPRDKAQVEGGAGDSSIASLVRLAGAVMCEQDEMWQESRCLSEAKMGELYDEGRTRGIDGTVDWAQLEAEAGKMIESGLELADRIDAA